MRKDALRDFEKRVQWVVLPENLPGSGLEGRYYPCFASPGPGRSYWKHRVKGMPESFLHLKASHDKKFIDIVESLPGAILRSRSGSYLQRSNQTAISIFTSSMIRRIPPTLKFEVCIVERHALMNEGPSSDPGELKPMVYERATGYTLVLRRMKRCLTLKAS
jgi:hypothetical protein